MHWIAYLTCHVVATLCPVMQPARPELYHYSAFPVFILQEESGASPGSSDSSSSTSGSSTADSGGSSSDSSADSGSSSRFVAAAGVPRPSIEQASSSGGSGQSPHDVRPLHGGAAFYGFPEFGPQAGEDQSTVHPQGVCVCV